MGRGVRTERVRGYLAAQVAAVRGVETRLAVAEPGAVHDARVAVRRVRSTLRTFPALAAGAHHRDLNERLRAWGRMLGGVRDQEVLRDLLAEVCTPDVAAVLTPELDESAVKGWAALEAERLSARHRTLLEDLAARALAEPTARIHPRRRAKAAARRARRRLAAAGTDPDALHAARRAAKRARYAAEAIGDERTAAEQRTVQDALGTHHDCVVALRYLAGSALSADQRAAPVAALRARAAAALSSISGIDD